MLLHMCLTHTIIMKCIEVGHESSGGIINRQWIKKLLSQCTLLAVLPPTKKYKYWNDYTNIDLEHKYLIVPHNISEMVNNILKMWHR